jgi:hypothetical protein
MPVSIVDDGSLSAFQLVMTAELEGSVQRYLHLCMMLLAQWSSSMGKPSSRTKADDQL